MVQKQTNENEIREVLSKLLPKFMAILLDNYSFLELPTEKWRNTCIHSKTAFILSYRGKDKIAKISNTECHRLEKYFPNMIMLYAVGKLLKR